MFLLLQLKLDYVAGVTVCGVPASVLPCLDAIVGKPDGAEPLRVDLHFPK